MDTTVENPHVHLTPEERLAQANKYVDRAAHWAFGASFIPVSGIDVAYVVGVQMTMVGQLSKLYDVKFSQNVARTAVLTLLGGGVPFLLSQGGAQMAIAAIPFVGKTLSVVTMSILSSATTYAVGKVFVQHFEAGGNVLNFDPNAMKDYFKDMFMEGKAKAQTAAAAK